MNIFENFKTSQHISAIFLNVKGLDVYYIQTFIRKPYVCFLAVGNHII